MPRLRNLPLGYRAKLGKWLLKAEAVPPSEIHELPGKDPIKIPEQFVSTRRNLLWYSAVLILVFAARVGDPSSGLITFPMIGASLPIDLLTILIWLAALPTAYSFDFFGRRISIAHSRAIHSTSFSTLYDGIKSIEANLNGWNSKVQTVVKGLDKVSPTTPEELRAEISMFVKMGKKHQDRAQKAYKLIPKILSPVRKSEEASQSSTMRSDAQSAADNLADACSDTFSELETLGNQIEKMLKRNATARSSIESATISNADAAIASIRRDFSALDEAINGSDIFKFKRVDLGVAWLVFAVATALTIVGFFETPVEFLNDLFQISEDETKRQISAPS